MLFKLFKRKQPKKAQSPEPSLYDLVWEDAQRKGTASNPHLLGKRFKVENLQTKSLTVKDSPTKKVK